MELFKVRSFFPRHIFTGQSKSIKAVNKEDHQSFFCEKRNILKALEHQMAMRMCMIWLIFQSLRDSNLCRRINVEMGSRDLKNDANFGDASVQRSLKQHFTFNLNSELNLKVFRGRNV